MKWHKFFLETAKHVSTMSKDPSTKVGAVIVDSSRRIVATGYNGFPRGVVDSQSRYEDRDMKYKLIVHAEANAIISARGEGCSIYIYPTLMIPACCPECAKLIVQSGIKHVYYYDATPEPRWEELSKYSEILLKEGKVSYNNI